MGLGGAVATGPPSIKKMQNTDFLLTLFLTNNFISLLSDLGDDDAGQARGISTVPPFASELVSAALKS